MACGYPVENTGDVSDWPTSDGIGEERGELKKIVSKKLLNKHTESDRSLLREMRTSE